jgi:hypothetical protein
MEVVGCGLVSDLEVVRPGSERRHRVAVRISQLDRGRVAHDSDEPRLADGVTRAGQREHDGDQDEDGGPHARVYEPAC